MIRATIVYLFMAIYIVLLALPAILYTILTRNNSLLFTLSRFCVRMAGFLSGVKVLVIGKEKILPGQTYVFLSNHQGNVDAPVFLHVIPRDWTALIKKEMMRLPILSLVLKRAQFVPIERLNPKQAHLGIEQGAKLLSEGKSFLAFPEGTRSRDGHLGTFKKGVFIMAIKAQTPIIPITILDSAKVQAPGEYRIRPGTIQVIIHDVIETKGMILEDRNLLVQRVREAIACALPS